MGKEKLCAKLPTSTAVGIETIMGQLKESSNAGPAKRTY